MFFSFFRDHLWCPFLEAGINGYLTIPKDHWTLLPRRDPDSVWRKVWVLKIARPIEGSGYLGIFRLGLHMCIVYQWRNEHQLLDGLFYIDDYINCMESCRGFLGIPRNQWDSIRWFYCCSPQITLELFFWSVDQSITTHIPITKSFRYQTWRYCTIRLFGGGVSLTYDSCISLPYSLYRWGDQPHLAVSPYVSVPVWWKWTGHKWVDKRNRCVNPFFATKTTY